MAAIAITDSEFNKVLNDNNIVVVDFWANWCGPCRLVSPIIDDLATDNENTSGVVISKLNVDENPDATNTYNIRGIPSILFFKNGELIDRVVGIPHKEVLQTKIDNLLVPVS